jgi:CheY-like chemotaxis protein
MHIINDEMGNGSLAKSKFRTKLLSDLEQDQNKKDVKCFPHDKNPSLDSDLRTTVLIVEDELEIREALTELLEDSNYRALSASSVKEAIRQLQSYPQVSIILLDIAMPEQDGFALLDYLKANLRFREIPVIMSTSCAQPEMVKRAKRYGVMDYIVKPYRINTVLSRISLVLESTQKRILVVTDDDLVAKLISQTMMRGKYKVQVADCGQKAIEILSQRNINAMISDLILEDMTGFDLLAKICDEYHWIPTLFISDAFVKISEKDIFAAGGHGLLRRPFNNLEIRRKIDQLVYGK